MLVCAYRNGAHQSLAEFSGVQRRIRKWHVNEWLPWKTAVGWCSCLSQEPFINSTISALKKPLLWVHVLNEVSYCLLDLEIIFRNAWTHT